MKEHIILFFSYLLIPAIVGLFFNQNDLSVLLKVIICLSLIIFFWKSLKFNFKIDWMSIAVGILIFLIWILLEGLYPLIGKTSAYVPPNMFYIIIRIISAILIAPIVEELFVRDFMNRFFQSENWRKVPAGKFTLLSFLLTVLFFGFSHDRWLPGIIAGVLLNLVYYYKKDIGYCITTHAVANICLSVYVLYFGAYKFW